MGTRTKAGRVRQPHLSRPEVARLARTSLLLDGRVRVLRAGPGVVEALVILGVDDERTYLLAAAQVGGHPT